MQNTKVLPLIGLALTLVALVSNYLFRPFELAKPRLLSVETFPMEVGTWRADRNRPVNAELFKIAPTAHVLDRLYTDGKGQTVNLTLVSAPRWQDIHDPMICFPAQGWTIGPKSEVQVDGQTYTRMTASRDKEKVEIFYTFTGRTVREDALASKLHAARSALIGSEGNSLLVRMIVPGEGENQPTLLDFARRIEAPLSVLQQQALKP